MRASGRQEDPRIEAVFFDIGNVLVRFDASTLAAKFAWELRSKPLKAAEMLLSSGWLDALERGRLSPGSFFRTLRDKAGFPDDFGLFRRLWCGHFRLEKKSIRLLERVARRRPVFLLSNTNAMHYEFIRRRYAFPRLVQGAVLSYRLGVRKPEPAIYRHALRMGAVRPARALFIDDMKENVEAARRMGFHVWRHVGPAALESRLDELGLL